MAEVGKILIVDDEPGIVSMLTKFFTRLGVTVFTAVSGREGLQLLEKERPDLILLDIWMPGQDGLQVLRRIRARYPDIDIIMMTGSKDVALAGEALALGASGYITKPFDMAYLENSVLAQFSARSSAPEAAFAEIEPSPPTTSVSPAPEVEPSVAIAQFLQAMASIDTATAAPPAPEVDEAVASAQLPAETRTPAEAVQATPAASPVFPLPDVESAVTLAAECFRLAVGLSPMRVARELEGCAAGLLEAIATGSDWRPRLSALRLYTRVAQKLGSVTPEELARLNALCDEVEAEP